MIKAIDFINECIDECECIDIKMYDSKSEISFYDSPIIEKNEFLTQDRFDGVRKFLTQHFNCINRVIPFSAVYDLPAHLLIEIWACENDFYFGGYYEK